MSQISKNALKVENNQSFPNNNTGYITPALLREFNVDMIDSTVNQSTYDTASAGWDNSIAALNTFTASQQPSFDALNGFTASQLTINSGVNTFTQSANGRLSALENDTNNLEAWTSSINEIRQNGILQGSSTRFFFSGFVSASIVANIDGPIAAIDILSDGSRLSTASFNAYTASTAASQSVFSASVASQFVTVNSTFNAYTASTNAWTASAKISIDELLALSSSLSGGYATQGELDQSASVLQANIDTKLNTSSFEAYTSSFSQSVATSFSQSYATINQITASNNISINALNAATASLQLQTADLISKTGSYATTGSNTFIGTQTFSGSIENNVFSASIVGTTASINFSSASFYTLTLPTSSNTHINVTGVRPGQSALLEITTIGAASTASFSSNVYQPSASLYVPTNGAGNDILTFASFASNKVYVVAVKSMLNT